jgi:hypothetical protein
MVLCCGSVRLALPIGPSPRLRVPAFRLLNRWHAANRPPWLSAASPASMPGRHRFSSLHAACWRGEPHRPAAKPQRIFECAFKGFKSSRRHKYHRSAFEPALGSPPPLSRPRGGALAQGKPAWMPAKPRWATEGPSGRALRKRAYARAP